MLENMVLDFRSTSRQSFLFRERPLRCWLMLRPIEKGMLKKGVVTSNYLRGPFEARRASGDAVHRQVDVQDA
jgi:hypothetical protein